MLQKSELFHGLPASHELLCETVPMATPFKGETRENTPCLNITLPPTGFEIYVLLYGRLQLVNVFFVCVFTMNVLFYVLVCYINGHTFC